MPGIQIVTDSACDLPVELTDDLGISVVPLTIRFGDEELVDRYELPTKDFWDRVVTGTHIPQTAAPSPGAFQTAFNEAADAGKDGVLCINLSSKVSATYQAARTAADSVADRIPVTVIDSLTMTMGLGLLVVEAAEILASGKSLQETGNAIEEAKSRAHVFGVVGGLDFLRRGGRIGGASHLFGSLLSIMPVLEVRDGAVEVDSKQRTRTRAIQYLASKAIEAGPLARIGLADGRSDDSNKVETMLEKATCATPLVKSDLGPVVGSHTGPGTVGVCFLLARN
jgi:DegV family protein with EDD domain